MCLPPPKLPSTYPVSFPRLVLPLPVLAPAPARFAPEIRPKSRAHSPRTVSPFHCACATCPAGRLLIRCTHHTSDARARPKSHRRAISMRGRLAELRWVRNVMKTEIPGVLIYRGAQRHSAGLLGTWKDYRQRGRRTAAHSSSLHQDAPQSPARHVQSTASAFPTEGAGWQCAWCATPAARLQDKALMDPLWTTSCVLHHSAPDQIQSHSALGSRRARDLRVLLSGKFSVRTRAHDAPHSAQMEATGEQMRRGGLNALSGSRACLYAADGTSNASGHEQHP